MGVSSELTKGKIEKVLMVDDDSNIRFITEMTLQGLTDWQIRLAESGKDALSKIEEECPDLVLLDMMMPDMDGITLFTEIKVLLGDSTPPVIFMTAKVQGQEVDRYKNMGAAGIIMKPFDPMTLPEKIYEILAAK